MRADPPGTAGQWHLAKGKHASLDNVAHSRRCGAARHQSILIGINHGLS
jgi:hypothetical protein